MSYTSRAVQWVQENNLEGHPDALKLYLAHLEKERKKKENLEISKDKLNLEIK